MARQLFANIAIALIWAFLHTSYTFKDFFIGFVIGAILLYIFQRRFGQDFYLRKILKVLKLSFIFLKEIVVANFQVFFLVIKPKLYLRPGIIQLPIDVRSPLKIVLLANMITLTPGTLTMEISPDNKILYIHVLDIGDEEAIKNDIRTKFENNIKECSK
ncbi:MAG: Na+/H+ antiporter subunit E [Clostridia bacterium]|nr:Na+/H+ antiporter subunit E [Clostridia bacterium]MDD4798164.1 Na+/H+ antiporter subunit E [Clostridia bacterium]